VKKKWREEECRGDAVSKRPNYILNNCTKRNLVQEQEKGEKKKKKKEKGGDGEEVSPRKEKKDKRKRGGGRRGGPRPKNDSTVVFRPKEKDN